MSLFKIKGVQSELEVFDDKLTITPKGVLGFLNQGVKGEKTIPFRSITAIQLKEAGWTSGYIQFSLLGGNESRGGILKATQDENTFMYANKKDNATVQAIKEHIEARLGPARPTAGATAGTNLADQLSQLAAMKVQGVLSEEEFTKAKGRLMRSDPPEAYVANHTVDGRSPLAAVQPVVPVLPQHESAIGRPAEKPTGRKGRWIALVVFLLVLAANAPRFGLLLGLVLIGLAVATMAKKINRSFFGLVAKARYDETTRIAKLARYEAAFGVLMVLLSVSAVRTEAEVEAAAEASAVAAAEAAERQKVATEEGLANLRATLPGALSAAKASLPAIDARISAEEFEPANQALADQIASLNAYTPLQSESADLAATVAELKTRQQRVSAIVDADRLGVQAIAAVEAGDSRAKNRAYLDADVSYQAALDLLAKIDPAHLGRANVEGLKASVEAKKERIATRVEQARADAQEAAELAAASAAAQEAKKARQFQLGDFYYWIEEGQFRQCIGNSFVRECAGPGATFVVVPYVMENTGKATATIMTSDFQIQDAEGRTFRTSSRAETALLMSGGAKDIVLSELQPGVQKTMTIAFEIPQSAKGLKLVIPEKGLLSVGKKVIPL